MNGLAVAHRRQNWQETRRRPCPVAGGGSWRQEAVSGDWWTVDVVPLGCREEATMAGWAGGVSWRCQGRGREVPPVGDVDTPPPPPRAAAGKGTLVGKRAADPNISIREAHLRGPHSCGKARRRGAQWQYISRHRKRANAALCAAAAFAE